MLLSRPGGKAVNNCEHPDWEPIPGGYYHRCTKCGKALHISDLLAWYQGTLTATRNMLKAWEQRAKDEDKPMTIKVLQPVYLHVGWDSKPLDSLTLAILDDPRDGKATIVDMDGTLLAHALTAPKPGWSVTPEGIARMDAESRTLISYGRPN